MKIRTKAAIVCYLTIWTTGIAWLAVLMIRPLFPELYTSVVRVERDVLEALPGFAPFLTLPIAFGLAMNAIRKREKIDRGMLIRYFVGAPVCIFLSLLTIVSLLTVVFAPIAFVMGLIYGAVPLLIGTAVHCLGMLPLLRLQFPQPSVDVRADVR